MHLPQVMLITLFALGLGMAMAQHGKPKTGNENFWYSLIATALQVAILYWGGFWK